MTACTCLTKPVHRARGILQAGRAPGCWEAGVAAAVEPASRLPALCGWIDEVASVETRLRRQPLFGTCLTDAVNGPEASCDPDDAAVPAPRPPTPYDPPVPTACVPPGDEPSAPPRAVPALEDPCVAPAREPRGAQAPRRLLECLAGQKPEAAAERPVAPPPPPPERAPLPQPCAPAAWASPVAKQAARRIEQAAWPTEPLSASPPGTRSLPKLENWMRAVPACGPRAPEPVLATARDRATRPPTSSAPSRRAAREAHEGGELSARPRRDMPEVTAPAPRDLSGALGDDTDGASARRRLPQRTLQPQSAAARATPVSATATVTGPTVPIRPEQPLGTATIVTESHPPLLAPRQPYQPSIPAASAALRRGALRESAPSQPESLADLTAKIGRILDDEARRHGIEV